jgi:hypothetical protein
VRILVTHDAQGNIHNVINPQEEDAPRAAVQVSPGLQVTEAEAEEEIVQKIASLDLSGVESQEQLAEIFQDLRVETRIVVRKTPEAESVSENS